MEIKDLINVQEQFSVDAPYAFALRVLDNDGNLAAHMARIVINDSDWIEETSPEEKNLKIIEACKKVATIKEINYDPNASLTTERGGMLLTHLIAQSNTIRTNARRGAGNKIIVNPAFMDILTKTGVINLPFFNAAQNGSSYLVNGCIEMIVADFDNEIPEALVAYKGTAHYDGGITMVTDTPNNRYMISTDLPDTEKYYVLIKLTPNGES